MNTVFCCKYLSLDCDRIDWVYFMGTYCRLSGVVVSVLATGPKGRRFKLDWGDGFLMVIKFRSTLSFGQAIRLESPCYKILRRVIEPCVAWLKCYISKIQRCLSPPPCVTARCLWCSQRALVIESGILELRWECTIGQKVTTVLIYRFCSSFRNIGHSPHTSIWPYSVRPFWLGSKLAHAQCLGCFTWHPAATVTSNGHRFINVGYSYFSL
jgi:hypothetical protein